MLHNLPAWFEIYWIHKNFTLHYFSKLSGDWKTRIRMFWNLHNSDPPPKKNIFCLHNANNPICRNQQRKTIRIKRGPLHDCRKAMSFEIKFWSHFPSWTNLHQKALGGSHQTVGARKEARFPAFCGFCLFSFSVSILSSNETPVGLCDRHKLYQVCSQLHWNDPLPGAQTKISSVPRQTSNHGPTKIFNGALLISDSTYWEFFPHLSTEVDDVKNWRKTSLHLWVLGQQSRVYAHHWVTIQLSWSLLSSSFWTATDPPLSCTPMLNLPLAWAIGQHDCPHDSMWCPPPQLLSVLHHVANVGTNDCMKWSHDQQGMTQV